MSLLDAAAEQSLESPRAVLALLERWVERGWLRPLDRAFAAFLHDQAPDAPPLLLLGAGLASHQLGRGHVCLDLARTLDEPDLTLSLPPEEDAEPDPPPRPAACLAGVDLQAWQAALDHPGLVGEGEGASPLVRVGPRLYLRRYWDYERSIGAALRRRVERGDKLLGVPATDALRPWLERLFAADRPAASGVNWQRIACALAARSAFSVITGGPGTGKTTTVVRLLALLQGLALEAGRAPLRIRLAAPTGKAAARLNESVAGAVGRLALPPGEPGEAVRAAIPTEVSTVHRLLGSRPDSRRFRHHAGNPLPLEVLVLDEASMVDVELMACVLAALPPQARLVLLGDKDQLASVEAGAVLGDLCQRAEVGHYTGVTAEWLAEVSGEQVPERYRDPQGRPLDQHIVMLRDSHRFGADSGIGELARRVNAGRAEQVDALWDSRRDGGDIAWRRLRDVEDPALERLIVAGGPAERDAESRYGYRRYLQVMLEARPDDAYDPARRDRWARAVLDAYGEFQLLCALRGGPWGVEGLNQRIARVLAGEGLIEAERQWYPGRPVMVTRNDYGLGLMNGDIGVTLSVPHDRDPERRMLRVAFLASDGSGRVRWILPSRLTAVQTAYAMTVHKSQGSEFVHTALVLPERDNPVLTRELVYTGITRASRWFTLVTVGEQVLRRAVERRVQRVSGLRV